MKSRISINKIFTIALLIIVLIIIYSITIGKQYAKSHDFLIYFTFGVNGLLWMYFLLQEVKEKAYSLVMIFWFFCIFFFFFAGLIQTMNNQFPWIGKHDDDLLLKTNVILFLWTIFFQLGIYFGKKIKFKHIKINNFKINEQEWDGYLYSTPILVLLSLFITIYRIYNIGFFNLLARGTSAFSASENASISVLIEKVFMSIVYFAFVFSVIYFRKTKQYIFMVLSGLCLLISYFPTSTSRNAVAGLYFGAMLIFFPKMKRNNIFVILYSAIFMIIFPLLNAFRTVAFIRVNIFDALASTLNNFSDGWLAVDYDAYSMVALTLRYNVEHGLSFGSQLLGVLFFWIPRSFWPSKPEGSGPVVAKFFGWWFTNVSEPLPAEMIINFGILGMCISAIICGFIICRLDKLYWDYKNLDHDFNSKYDTLYTYMIGYFLFLYRGALLSAVAYLVAVIVVWKIITIKCLIKKKSICN